MNKKVVIYCLVTFLISLITELDHYNFSFNEVKEHLYGIMLKASLPILVTFKALYDKPTDRVISSTELIQVKDYNGTITTTERCTETLSRDV
jgi:hypothetical protein